MPDYYGILGLSRDAGVEDIKRAYRKLARESHPDANPEDRHAEERFKQIGEAYQVLADPEKRRRYDTFGDAGPGAGGFGDFSDIFGAFFGGSPFGRARTRTRSSAVAGQDIGVSVTLTLEEAVFGARRDLQFPSAARCARCSGDGCEPGTFRGRCSTCAGAGAIRASRQTILGTVMTERPCGACGGAGESPAVPCTECRGEGRTATTREVTVDVPAGVADGTTLRLRGRGEEGARGGPDGDLFVRIHVQQHEVFERDGDDLVCELVVPLTQAVLGASILLETLDGKQDIAVPAGTPHGAVLGLRGHGATRLDGRGRGDLRVHVRVQIPRNLAPEERALFEQIADLRGEAVNGEQRGIFRRLRDTLLGE